MKEIKNIIFDLGGVIIDLDRRDAIDALDRLGLKDASALLGEYAQQGPFLMLETGQISESELFDIFLPHCTQGTTCTDIRDAFEEFLREIPPERLDMLDALRKKGFRLYVLSNTNPLMYNHWIDNAFRNRGKSINDYFDGIVVSYQERICKPDPKIFKNLISRYGLDASETLILDDFEANCKGAESVGLTALQVKAEGDDSFMEICKRILNGEAIR